MKFSVIIVEWNTAALLKQTLDSVYKETKIVDFEIIVVDNNSADGSVEMVKKDFPRVKLLENNANLGFAKANNQGLKLATGEYVASF